MNHPHVKPLLLREGPSKKALQRAFVANCFEDGVSAAQSVEQASFFPAVRPQGTHRASVFAAYAKLSITPQWSHFGEN